MTGAANPGQLVCAGQFFPDLIAADVERLPALGPEVKSGDFSISIGGSAAISATFAALTGPPTELITASGPSVPDREARKGLWETGGRGPSHVRAARAMTQPSK